MNYIPPKFIHWGPNTQYIRMSLYLKVGSLRDNYVKMRLTGWALTQFDWGPYKKRKFGQRDRDVHPQRNDYTKTP